MGHFSTQVVVDGGHSSEIGYRQKKQAFWILYVAHALMKFKRLGGVRYVILTLVCCKMNWIQYSVCRSWKTLLSNARDNFIGTFVSTIGTVIWQPLVMDGVAIKRLSICIGYSNERGAYS